jgi:hypothetical protein
VANPACIYCGGELPDGLASLSLACHDCRHPVHGSWAPPSWWRTADEDDSSSDPPDSPEE